MKKAFTMIELVFVIVVIGILSAIAIPKFAVTRNDAVESKAKSTVAAMRTALAMERQKRILQGDFDDINVSTVESLMEYGLDDRWTRDDANNKFTFTSPTGETCDFNITNNKLLKSDCDVDSLSDL